MSACAKGVQGQRALSPPAIQTADLMPVVITFTAAISACAKDEQWQPVLGLLAMQTADLMPVVITYTAAVSAGAKDENGSRHSAYRRCRRLI